MLPTIMAAAQLRHQILYHIDNEFLENANFLAGRLHALEPRNPESSHLLALTYFRLRRFKASFDAAQKYGANGRHLGCAFVFAQACLRLGWHPEGTTALDKARGLWAGKNNRAKQSETSRRLLPDAAAVHNLLAKLWHAFGDWKKAGDHYIEAHKANPFIWDAFEGLCKVGADLQPQRMFCLPLEFRGLPPATGVPEIYTDQQKEPVGASQPACNPLSDPFGPSGLDFKPAVAQCGTLNGKEKPAFGGGFKALPSEWDTPGGTDSGLMEEDVVMGGLSADTEYPPAAPPRRPKLGHRFEASDRPRQPALKGPIPSTSEINEDSLAAPRKPGVGGHKRTISAQPPPPSTMAAAATESGAQPRRSNRLFGQGATRSTRSTVESTASIAGRTDSRPAKAATGTKGRIGSTVGRVVSGNRKMLPPDRGDKEKEKRAPSRASDRSATALGVVSYTLQKPAESSVHESDAVIEREALASLLDSLRSIALGVYSTARFDSVTALRVFRGLPSSQRETPFILAQIGRAHYEAGDYRAAEESFERLLKLQPSRTQDLEIYSTVLWHLRKEAALGHLCYVLKDTASNAPETWCAIGNAFSLSREHDQAIAAFRRAIQVDDGFAYAWTLMGHEYIANEEFDAALNCFRKAVSIDRRGYGGWYGLGKSYERLGKLEDSERHYRIAASVNPSNATLLVCIGVVLERLRNKRGALLSYTRALDLAPQSALARFKKARVLMYLRRHDEALEELEILRDTAPEEANVWFLLGKCYKGLGQIGMALKAYTTALNLDVKVSFLFFPTGIRRATTPR